MRTEKQKKSDAQEARWADLVGGEVVRGSGSGWRHRQDVKDETHLWECKGTDAASISFKCEWWDQLRGSAAADGLLPGSHVEIRGGEGRTRRLVVLDEGDLQAG